jgi:hypothetical protein
MMNLFLLVTLQSYDEFHQKSENPVENFRRITNGFRDSWNIYSNDIDKGERIKHNCLPDFIMTLNIDFIEPYKLTLDKSTKYIFDLNLLV